MNQRKLRVAAVQMQSANGMVQANLQRASRLVEDAAARGSQLVLVPELLSIGFELNARAWESAEPQGAATATWLCEMARRFKLHIGGSYLEALGGDFYNTFALAAPAGKIAGRVRKEHPCSIEAYIFKDLQDRASSRLPSGASASPSAMTAACAAPTTHCSPRTWISCCSRCRRRAR